MMQTFFRRAWKTCFVLTVYAAIIAALLYFDIRFLSNEMIKNIHASEKLHQTLDAVFAFFRALGMFALFGLPYVTGIMAMLVIVRAPTRWMRAADAIEKKAIRDVIIRWVALVAVGFILMTLVRHFVPVKEVPEIKAQPKAMYLEGTDSLTEDEIRDKINGRN